MTIPTPLPWKPIPQGPFVARALTSLAPSPGADQYRHVKECIESWRTADLDVYSFNAPSEIAALSSLYDVTFVPVRDTTEKVFGRPYVPISAMLRWAAESGGPMLIINSDIELELTPQQLRRAYVLSDGGLCYFVRQNYTVHRSQAEGERYGIDAFLFNGHHGQLFPSSWMSMGQTWWDFWLPYVFAANKLPLMSVEYGAAFHRNHSLGWSMENWFRCASEFDRVTGALGGETNQDLILSVCRAIRDRFNAQRRILSRADLSGMPKNCLTPRDHAA